MVSYDGIPYQVKQRTGDRGITAENVEKSQHTDFNEDIRLMKALVWPVPSVEESVRMTEDIDKWRKCVHGVANPGIEDG